MLNLPDIRVVEAHDLLLAEAVGPSDNSGPRAIEAVSPRFTLADLRRRGRYLLALTSSTYDQAAAWIGDHMLPALPFVPDELP